jgi:hypothetical protein
LAGVRSYLLGGTEDVYWMQLKGSSQVEGILEEVLGPTLTPDKQIHDFVYHLSGSITGQAMTYHLVALTPNTPAFPDALTGTVTSQSVVLGEPLAGSSHPVLTPATQAQFRTLVKVHENAWNVDAQGQVRSDVCLSVRSIRRFVIRSRETSEAFVCLVRRYDQGEG